MRDGQMKLRALCQRWGSRSYRAILTFLQPTCREHCLNTHCLSECLQVGRVGALLVDTSSLHAVSECVLYRVNISAPLPQQVHTTSASECTVSHNRVDSQAKFSLSLLTAHQLEENVVGTEDCSLAHLQSLSSQISFKEVTLQQWMLASHTRDQDTRSVASLFTSTVVNSLESR